MARLLGTLSGLAGEGKVLSEDPRDVLVPEGQDPLPASLPEDRRLAAPEVDVGRAQVADLGHAGAGGEEQLQHRDVPDQDAIRLRFPVPHLSLETVDVPEQPLQVGQGDRPRQALLLLDPDVDFPEGVHQDLVLPLQVVEEGFERGNLPFDALVGQVVPEQALDVGPEGDLVDPAQLGQAEPGLQIDPELAQVDLVGLEGLGAEVLLVLAVKEKLCNRILYGHPRSSQGLDGEDDNARGGDLGSVRREFVKNR